jgi:hypothetical protein
MGGIFGKRGRSESKNVNNDLLKSAYGDAMGATGSSINSLQALLGGDASGFRKFTDAIDLSGQAEYGSRGITGNAAARGLLRSGSTGKALVGYEQMLENQASDQYMNRLLGVGELGLGAGQIVSQAGQQSRQREGGKSGFGKFLGNAAAAVAMSDERLKTNITPVGKNRDGLTVYQYMYNDGSGPFIGVMAQEVAKIKPEALGPEVNGYRSVDYSKVNIIDRSYE